MAALKRFDGEHLETSHHACRIQHTKRWEADGTVMVEFVIEEVEIRTNIKHLTMNQSKAGKQPQTDAGTLSKLKSFKSKGPPSHGTNSSLRSLKKRRTSKHALLELSRKNSNILDESNQDLGGHDLIDLIDSPHRHHDDEWTENCKSPVWGLNGYSSPVMSNLVLQSDSDESNTAQSYTTSALVLDSESEDDGQPVNPSMSQSTGPNMSPELSTTPSSLIPFPFNSQNTTVKSGDVVDGNVSDDSHCSIASGPSKLPHPVVQGLCTHCLRLYMRMKRQLHWTKSVVKDPACLYYDQWWLLKPWRPRGMCVPRRVRGKLFEHLPLIWQRAKVQAERDLVDECEVCIRSHVFLQRNLRQCKKPRPNSLYQAQPRNKARSRRGRRSVNRWPPIGGGRQARKSKSIEHSVKEGKKKEMEQRGRGRPKREETDRGQKLLGEEHLTFDLTEDCCTGEHASLSPGKLQDVNTDIESSRFSDKHGRVNTLSSSGMQADAKVGSQSHRHTDNLGYVGSSPYGREDSLIDLRTDSPRDRHGDGHKARLCPGPCLTADRHRGRKIFKYVASGADRDAGRGAETQPLIHLFRCSDVNRNISTDKQAVWLKQTPHKPTKVKHKVKDSCPQSADRPTGNNVDVGLNRNADDQVTCLTSAEGQTKSLPVDSLDRHSDVDPNIHLDWAGRPVDRCVGGDSGLSAGVEQACRAPSFEGVLKKPPPTTPLMASSDIPVMGSGQTEGDAAVPPSKDPYVFHTPTPPRTQCSEVLRKLRPFARTYESRGTESGGFKSMLCSFDKMPRGVVHEADP